MAATDPTTGAPVPSTSPNVAAPGTVDLQVLMAAGLGLASNVVMAAMANDLQMNARADQRYHHVLDRSFLSTLLQDSTSVTKDVGELNTVSHTPYPQPWSSPTRPVGT